MTGEATRRKGPTPKQQGMVQIITRVTLQQRDKVRAIADKIGISQCELIREWIDRAEGGK